LSGLFFIDGDATDITPKKNRFQAFYFEKKGGWKDFRSPFNFEIRKGRRKAALSISLSISPENNGDRVISGPR